jgi:tRNA (guanosine-2'-O-)-methyltransferase
MKGPAADRRWRELPSPIGDEPLDALITPARAWTYRQVLARRTRRLCVVVEECHDPHNATAIIRTCDAFGVHTVAVVTGRNTFKVNRKVSQGSHFYVDLRHHTSIEDCYARLRADGYRILATDLATGAVSSAAALQAELDRQPLALVFGNEGSGVSEAASRLADGHVLIPMVGFPQSLNLSVSVTALVYGLRAAALGEDQPGDLDAEQQRHWYRTWIRNHVGDEGCDRLLGRAEVGKHGEDLDALG